LEQDLQGVSAGEVCACCDPGVDLKEGVANFRFGGNADGGMVIGAVGDEGLETFQDNAEGEGGECKGCGGRRLEGEERGEYASECWWVWVFRVHAVQPGYARARFESCFAAGNI
jgi:hypothetical protein